MSKPKTRGALLVLLCTALTVGCDDEDDIVAPTVDSSSVPVVAGIYQGFLQTTRFSCMDPGGFAQVVTTVEQDGDRITIETEDDIRVEGRIFEIGIFSATGEAFFPEFTGHAEIRMFGQFEERGGGIRLQATRLLDGSAGDVICETTQNLEAFGGPDL